MQDSSKYLIHADVTADGIVERTDVVGAVFGQTEGLLGDDLDLRHLQDASKIGRIDVEIESQNGQSYGELTIATNLDKVETATLAAALETITRIGPCRATVEVRSLEDLRAAKRRRIVERARELLVETFDDSMMTSEELVEEVRRRIRVENITEYEGLPAGPRVEDSDAVVVVEGRSDVLTVLEAGVKNAIAVEGTDVPDAVASLTERRRTTAFLDGDRGGDLILKELAQVGKVDSVAFAPEGRSVEDLSRHEVLVALRGKVDYELVADVDAPHETVAPATTESERSGGDVPDPNDGAGSDTAPGTTQGSEADVEARPGSTGGPKHSESKDGRATDAEGGRAADVEREPADRTARVRRDETAPESETGTGGGVSPAGESTDGGIEPDTVDAPTAADAASNRHHDDTGQHAESTDSSAAVPGDSAATEGDERAPAEREVAHTEDDVEPSTDTDLADETDSGTTAAADSGTADSLYDHVEDTVDSGTVRLLDGDLARLSTDDADTAFDVLAEADPVPAIVVLDGTADQRLLDVAAQRGVERIVATSLGEFTKRPTSVRLTEAAALLNDPA